jgi:hypothetical protein
MRGVMKYLTVILALWILNVSAVRAQLQLQGISANDFVQSLFNPTGAPPEIVSVTLLGAPQQLGKFEGGGPMDIGISEGVHLTTGTFSYPTRFTHNPCTGETQNTFYDPSETYYDPDLATIASGTQVKPAGIEFEFRAKGSIMEFEFVFASEEYLDFVNSAYNDRFGFFLSGPGISGQFTNGASNIAVVNGSYISIDNVNDVNNPEYFIYNPCTLATRQITYDGLTTVIKISAAVQCDEIYKLKLAISNFGDDALDSGVFLKKHSLKFNHDIGQLTAFPSPLCEGADLTLTMDASAGYFYTWSTGQSGQGLNTITVPVQLDHEYSVEIAADGDRCLFNRSVEVNVHPQNNIPPYSTGINGTNGFTAYGQAGQELCFTVQTVDNPDEEVNISSGLDQVVPTGMSANVNNTINQASAEFCWTPSVDDFGIYTFNLNYADNNQCVSFPNTDLITVHVLCPNCPLGIAYENRTPSNNPLPSETRMGQWITAGLTQPVSTGEAEVLFQAGERIEVGPYFTAGPGYTQEIVPTCVDEEDCASCCEDWGGFTFNPPGNGWITPNGDDCNDVWYLQDTQNPNCAFNAMGFRLEIRTPAMSLVYSLERNHEYCCPFTAPEGNPPPCPTSVPQQYSSIYWPGINGIGCFVNDGTYYYAVELRSGCGHTQELAGYITVSASPGPTECGQYSVLPTGGMMEAMPDKEWASEMMPPTDGETSRQTLLLSYAPEYETAHVRLAPDADHERIIRAELFALDGRLIAARHDCGSTCSLNLNGQATGIYILRTVTDGGSAKSLKILKQ